MTTDVTQFISELDGGVFEEKLSKILSDVAAAVIDQDKAGKVSIDLSLKRIGTSYQVAIEHTLKYVRPTAKGKIAEENKTETPMHVGKGGAMTLFPEDAFPGNDSQGHIFTKQTEK